jgi:hypothetical protein
MLLTLANLTGRPALNQFVALERGQEGSSKILKQLKLLSIANVLPSNTGIKLDRGAWRTKMGLPKWFDENWTIIQPSLDRGAFEDSQHN